MAKSAATWEGRRGMSDNPSTSPAAYQTAARKLMEMDYLSEAAIFFERAGDEDGLLEILYKAMAEGNFFVFQAAATRLKNNRVDRAQVVALLEAAERAGRASYSAQAAAYLKEHY